MADISKIKLEDVSYNIKDGTARSDISTLNTTVGNIGNAITNVSDDLIEYKTMQSLQVCDATPFKTLTAPIDGAYVQSMDYDIDHSKWYVLW